ncbi:hypothetical protein D3C84_1283900 [compost metagenome]
MQALKLRDHDTLHAFECLHRRDDATQINTFSEAQLVGMEKPAAATVQHPVAQGVQNGGLDMASQITRLHTHR